MAVNIDRMRCEVAVGGVAANGDGPLLRNVRQGLFGLLGNFARPFFIVETLDEIM